ncbi:hypothetical protein AB6N29_03670 [Fusobacterium animalis]|uniref:hypothetical protein n=1 Tax=Fusobacterium animalis TaxID=76859 RepID=UPI0034DE113D
MNKLNEVDLLDMTGTTKLEENYISKSLNYGYQSAKNMTKLMFNDLMNSSDKDMVAGEKSKKRFDYNPDKKVEKLENKISKRKEMMNIYRESELANRREYEYFYNSLGDNTFQKVTSQLVYGAASTLFNPIELTKNIAINTAVNALIPGSGVVASIGRFGVNMFSDTVDNYYSNTWEDKLLGLEREPSEKLVQAVGGAVVSNAVFPLVKITGKKVFNFATDNIFVKGKTINGDILEPIVFNNYRKELGEVTAIDLSHRDYKIVDSIRKEVIKSQPIEEGMQRVFPKQEIKNNIIRERTGVEPGIIDFTRGREELLDIGNILKKKGIEIQAKSKKEINLSEAIRKSNRNMDKMALDWVDRYISAPYIVTKDGYKVETLKSMRDMHPMFYDTLSMSFKGQGYNDVLGEALEDKSVVNSVLFQVSKKKQMPFLIKDVDDPGWDIKKLDNFSYKKNNDFRRAIENGITYNVKENEALLKTSPKYNKYLSNTDNIESFAKEVADVFNDYKSKNLTYDEVVAVLEAKRSKYETIAITKPNGGEMSYKEFLNIGSKTIRDKEFNIDKLVNDVEAIKQKKVDTAIIKLSINKDKMLEDLAIKDVEFFKKNFGEKLNNLKFIAEGGEFDDNFKKQLHHFLTETTKDVREIELDMKEAGLKETDLDNYDLMKFIKNNFVGESQEEKINNFLDFAEPYLKDNYDMLNIMDRLIMNEQAAMSTWGVPFKVLDDLVKEDGSLLSFFNTIPILRKNLLDGKNFIEEYEHNKGFKEIAPVVMEKINNFIKSESIFKSSVQKEPAKEVVNTMLGFTRGWLLFASGIKETLSHPVLATLKALKYGGNSVKNLLVAPISAVSTAYNLLEPLASSSYHLGKLYRGIGKFIAGDYADELALMELGVNAKMLLGNGEISGYSKFKNVLSSTSMMFQNSMQKNRYIASRIIGINTIKKMLNTENFVELKPSSKKLLQALGIGNDESFKLWKQEVNSSDNGLKKALYQDGYSDITKKIHQLITRNAYEEDTLSPLRNNTEINDMTAQIKLMFTSYNRSILKYFGDAVRFAELEDGTYINRFSIEAIGRDIKDLTSVGLPGLTLLGIASLAGKYGEAKILGSSEDERMEAQFKSALDGNIDSMLGIAQDGLEGAIPIDVIYQRRGGSPISSVYNRIHSGITGDLTNLVPEKVEIFTRKFFNSREYKKYSGLNKQEKIIYDRLVLADKVANNKENNFIDYLIAKFTSDRAIEDGEMTAIDALELKRQYGYNDKEIMEKLKKRGIDTVKKYSIINSENEEEVIQNIQNGIEIISENKLSEKEIVEKLDEKNEFFNNYKEYKKEVKEAEVNQDEQKELEAYQKKLEAEGYDEFEILEKLTIYQNELHKSKNLTYNK